MIQVEPVAIHGEQMKHINSVTLVVIMWNSDKTRSTTVILCVLITKVEPIAIQGDRMEHIHSVTLVVITRNSVEGRILTSYNWTEHGLPR